MRQRNSLKMIGLSLITSAVLIGCGGGRSTTPSTTATGLDGSIIKGPIDGATISVYDENHNKVVSTTSKAGKFKLDTFDLNSSYYTIESLGGSYTDESTSTTVNIPSTDGLKTILTKAEFQSMLTKKEFSAITPETTILTALVKSRLEAGKDLATANSEAEKIVYDLMIKDTSPLSVLSGDALLKKGDFTKTTPSGSGEAFARNRAISFSNLMKDLNLEPSQVFEVISKLAVDYNDGKADTITIVDKDSVSKEVNATESYALARTELFQETTTKLRNGDISDAQREELRAMGLNVDGFQNDRANKEANLTAEINNALNEVNLPSLHILPTMTDEDGDTTDAKATYTLTANKDVNVTIETPRGSWITPMWRYNNNTLPMVIRTNRANAMTLNLNNQLDSNSTIHWHGFKIPADMDGGPDVPVVSGASKAYTFTMDQPAAPLWFHPHPDMQTGKQVYMGLAGVFLLEDDISKTLEANNELPSGDKDVVLLVQDRRFATEVNGVRELQYKTMQMDSDGMLGDKILVNGSILPKLDVDTTQYRLRLYNVSNARNYDFAFDDNRSFKIVATDGGLLNTPVEVNSIRLGAAERVEIVVNFSQDAVGKKVLLVSKASNGDMMSMMGGGNSGSGMNGNTGSGTGSGMNGNAGSGMGSGMNGNAGSGMDSGMNGNSGSGMGAGNMDGMLANSQGFVIMRFDVTATATDSVTLYSSLPSTAEIATRLDPTTATNADNERQFVMSMGGMDNMQGNSGTASTGTQNGMQNMSFVINGKEFNSTRVEEFVPAGATEIWKITNRSPMAHPFHAHAIQYQILDRNGIPATGTDLGWKDTFLVQPGETVRIIGKFEAINTGDYMYHCHILEHEDAGMMGYFRVGETGNLGPQ